MAERMVNRKLAAILSADVVGYSKLMADDEAATVDTIKQYRAAIGHVIERHKGRIVNAPGDNILAEFASAVEAVKAAVEIQRSIEGRNVELPEERRMHFRIGLNLGDVIQEDDGTIYGDGVNIAARMEALADEGGICISSTIHDAVEGKLDFGFDFLGERPVKNIAKPVRVYRVRGEPGEKPKKPTAGRTKKRAMVAATGVLVVAIASVMIWQFGRSPASEETKTAATDDQVLAPPTGPSIAVLPFDNMSGDSEQEYFSDGLTEDIITELARFPGIRVLARNTTFQYKGKAVDVQEIGRELGVAYVLEGGVRRSGDQIRITAQLIDVADGSHLWAERYDRELTDIFAVQDEITGRIVSALAAGYGVLERVGQKKATRKDPDQLKAYDMVLRARGYYNVFRPEEYQKSKALLYKAIALDPENAQAHIELAWWTMIGWVFRFEQSDTPPPEIKAAAVKAAALAPSDAYAHMVAAFGYFYDKQLDLFERETEKAFELAPNNPAIVAPLGALFTFSGQFDRGESLVKKAYDYNPTAAAGWYHSAMFYAHYFRGEYQASIDIIRQHPLQFLCENSLKYVAAYGQLGNTGKAQEYWQKCVDSEGGWSIEQTRDFWTIWNFPEQNLGKLMIGIHKGLGDSEKRLTN